MVLSLIGDLGLAQVGRQSCCRLHQQAALWRGLNLIYAVRPDQQTAYGLAAFTHFNEPCFTAPVSICDKPRGGELGSGSGSDGGLCAL
jgi:hypothetical protein